MALPHFGVGNRVMQGWNQTLLLNGVAVKVTSFNIGITQNAELPNLVTGRSDKLAFQKGVIEVGGNISAPLTNSLGDVLLLAADDVPFGGGAITMQSSAIADDIDFEIYINQLTITANAGDPIQVSADFIGRIINASDPDNFSSGRGTITQGLVGAVDGVLETGYITEQIPMFDRVSIDSGFLPSGSITNQIPISLTFTINNNLQANYVLGVDGTGSLNPFSISSGQRLLSGSMSFQSGYGAGAKLATIINAGASVGGSGGFSISRSADHNNSGGGGNILQVSGGNFVPIWNAAPPTVGTDRLTYDVEYKLLATSAGIHRIAGV